MNWTENIKNYRFKFYSQNGEEGFITNIMNKIGGWEDKIIVDLGAWDGTYLSNTRYFEQIGATRIMIDGDNHGCNDVHEHWITKDNICELLNKYEVPCEFDLLNIDLDGNDADILEAILKEFKPKLIVSEFNGAIEGCKKMLYDEKHEWQGDDYYGYSFEYGKTIAYDSGYKIVFENDSTNLYYVREDLLDKNMNIDVNPKIIKYHKHRDGDWVDKNMAWEGTAFNGDVHLRTAFTRIRDVYGTDVVIETGTYKGDSTIWFASNFKMVYTIELNREYYMESAKRLIGTSVKTLFGDSSEYLESILKSITGRAIVFLDAHWYANPLEGEFAAIKRSGATPVIVIHDFQNPHHPEFKYDSYPDQEYSFTAIKPFLDEIYDGEYDYYYNQKATGAMVGCLFVTPR